LGDSILEGVHVLPLQVVNIRLEEMLAANGYPNAEVLNFGIGGIGTTQELLVYETRVRRFKPDAVVLLFLRSNDIMNNSAEIQRSVYGIHTWHAPYHQITPDGGLRLQGVAPRRFQRFRTLLEEKSQLLYYAERAWFRVNFGVPLWQGIPLAWAVFSNPLDESWQVAWNLTERVLALLNETVSRDGIPFLVLVLPEPFDLDPGWRARMERTVGPIPPLFQPFASASRLEEIARQNGIKLDFLAPSLKRYRDKNDLQWPYIYLSCDSHLSASGHSALAESLFEALLRNQILPTKRQPSSSRSSGSISDGSIGAWPASPTQSDPGYGSFAISP